MSLRSNAMGSTVGGTIAFAIVGCLALAIGLFSGNGGGQMAFAAGGGLVALSACLFAFTYRPLRAYAPLVLLAFALFISEATFRTRDYQDKSIDFQVLIKLAALAACAGVAAYYFTVSKTVLLSGTARLWGAFFLWLIVTSMLAPNPSFAFIAAASVFVYYLYFAAVLPKFGEVRVAIAILAGVGALSLLSLGAYYFIPSFGHDFSWQNGTYGANARIRGITTAPNAIGAASGCGLLLMALYWRQLGNRLLLKLAAAAMFSWTLYLSDNRMTIIAVAAMAAAYYMFSVRRPFWITATVAVGLAGIIIANPYIEQIMVGLSRTGDANEILTLTNRTLIWSVAWDLWSQRPFFGWGYASTVYLLPNYGGLFANTANTHNVYLEVLFTSGLVGLFLFLLAAVFSLVEAWRAGHRAALTLLGFVLIHGLTEAQPFNSAAASPLPLLLLAIFAVASMRSRSAAPRKAAASLPLNQPA